jgi:threonine/homoserine/homoserine lactone efflux protein
MLSAPLYFAFLLTSLALIGFPGPNVALIVSTSIAHGRRAGLVTVAGTSSAMALQLSVTVAGTSALLAAAAPWFSWLRWAGVAYLVYIGVRAWLAPVSNAGENQAEVPASRAVFIRGVVVSLTNPKTLLFFGAFLPQFVSPEKAALPQLFVLATTFLVLAVALDTAWALLAHRAGALLSQRKDLRNRVEGGLLIGAGVGLAVARES